MFICLQFFTDYSCDYILQVGNAKTRKAISLIEVL